MTKTAKGKLGDITLAEARNFIQVLSNNKELHQISTELHGLRIDINDLNATLVRIASCADAVKTILEDPVTYLSLNECPADGDPPSSG